MSRLRRLARIFFNDATVSLLKTIGWFLVPGVFFCLGLALLTSVPTALIFLASLALVTVLYVRFSDKHMEHQEYDDKPTNQHWIEAREKYFAMLREKDKKDGKKEH